MMIVDDEPFIVDSLKELVEEESGLDIEVHKAYSGVEALAVMEQLKMDIVLTDIRMPVLDGLELQMKILARWPRCKIIFLTGHEHFDYVQTVIRRGGFDYILKTEADSRIIEALSKAVAVLQEEFEYHSVLEQAKRKYREAMPLMQHQFFRDLLEGELHHHATFRQRCGELGILLDPDKPVWFVTGRVDAWQPEHTPHDKLLFLYSIQNVAAEYFAPQAVFYAYEDRHYFYWLLVLCEGGETKQEQAIIQGLLESIQHTCGKLLPLTLSFAISAEPASFDKLAEAKERGAQLLRQGLGRQRETMLWEEAPVIRQRIKAGGIHHPAFGQRSGFVRELRMCLDAGDLASIRTMCEQWAQAMSDYGDEFAVHMEHYYSVALVFLAYINDTRLQQVPELRHLPHELMQIDNHGTWEEVCRYFISCSELLIQFREEEQSELTNEWIANIHRHIDNRLGEDLTLSGIADLVYLNPSYLSRLYKQMTGRGLFEYIKERRLQEAKYLLRETPIKIHEIGKKIGMAAPAYFSRFFRKETGLTPQEYRDGKEVNRSK
ncbi:response regulator [Paenibacillus sp. GCM10027626]|uniref:response regulator n=1 Tax=Paenibacillus sp. GCM10027626 TaxID=3273411 RepID=UPI0036384019